jgi:hypothetical protein
MKIDPPIKYVLYQVVIYIFSIFYSSDECDVFCISRSGSMIIFHIIFLLHVKYGASSFEKRERNFFILPKEINYLS